MKPRLTIESGDGSPHLCELDEGRTITLGRNRTNVIILQDKHASRWHAELFFQDGRWHIRDCGTLNGTKLNGDRIQQPTPLEDGDVVGVGDTRLRFRLGRDQADTPNGDLAEDHSSLPLFDEAQTPFHEDDLSALCGFMDASLREESPRELISRALAVVYRQTEAAVTGFLSLDQANPLPKIVMPEQARVDIHLSRQLTLRAQREGKAVWLGAQAGSITQSESLLAFRDALCVPLQAGESTPPLGALHVYQAGRLFTERQFRFCDVVARYLSYCLHLLRTRRILAAENSRLRDHAPAAADDGLIGDSTALQSLRNQISRVAPHNNVILIRGESGVGKELVAQTLHRLSGREGPLVVVNCAAIAATLAESELFGHARNSFTGAEERAGFFKQADEGTLFLDEIGELPLDLQAKLLRVIEGYPFRAVGGTKDIKVDVRVVAATHRDLEQEAAEGRFRKDLFYRLGIGLRVPPLREHPEDIPALVEHFLRKLANNYHRCPLPTSEALTRLQEYPWPGNVRQLWTVLEYAVAHCESDRLEVLDLPLPEPPAAAVPVNEESDLNLKQMEGRAIREALHRSRGVLKEAARILGIHRDTLVTKMRTYGIDKHEP